MKLLKNVPALAFVAAEVLKNSKNGREIDKLRQSGDTEAEKARIHKTFHEWAEIMFDRFDEKLVIVNEENLPEDEACVYIANHQSYFDIVAMFLAVKNQVGFITKDYFKKIPVFGPWIERLHGIFIARDNPREALKVINAGAESIKAGYSVMIFPEGTRGDSEEIGEFKPGAFKLATKAKAKIIPVTINGTRAIYEEKGEITPGRTVELVVHEPIDTALMSRAELAELPKKVEELIRSGQKSSCNLT